MRRGGLIAALVGALVSLSSGTSARAASVVEYRGLLITVPPGWRVHHLGPRSTECVRFDRHAIYLGRAGVDQVCPAHAVGRTEALHIEPLGPQAASLASGMLGRDTTAPSPSPPAAPSPPPATASPSPLGSLGSLGGGVTRTYVGRLPALSVRDASAGEVQVAVPDAGVLITGSYGDGPRRLERVIVGITAAPDRNERNDDRSDDRSDDRNDDGSGGGSPRGERHLWVSRLGDGHGRLGRREDGREERRRWVTGRGFDTCAAPSLAAMRAWRKDFVAANIYIGGPARACPDGRLSRDWVGAVRAMGWRLIPTYVGPQAPCASSRPRFSPRNAADAGQWSAADAVGRADALGLPRGAPIYLDLEAYRSGASCRRAVLTFVDSWSRGLRALAYTPGVYSSVASGIRDLGEADGILKPAAIWFAHWDSRPGVRYDEYLSDEWWPGHRRIKQYRGDHYETHGGVRLHIDSDSVDGFVH